MDLSFVPSLEHLSCERIVMFMFKDSDLKWHSEDDYFRIKSEVTEKISNLIPCDLLRKKLKSLIAPLLYDIKNFISIFKKYWRGLEIGYPLVKDTIPQCRRHDGTVDREKFVNLLIANEGIGPLNRFVWACIFCIFEAVSALWNSLDRIEKAYLRYQSSISYSETWYSMMRFWIEWLDGNTNKDWESFVAWALETPLWKSNVHILKRVLQTLSPMERNQYLLKALTGKEVESDMMRYGLSLLPRDEREVVFRESTIEVFRCILSSPLISVFSDFASKLWPYVTEDSFCRILEIILVMIKEERNELFELLVTLKMFWAQSPEHYKTFAERDMYMFPSVKFILEFDFAQQFQETIRVQSRQINHSTDV